MQQTKLTHEHNASISSPIAFVAGLSVEEQIAFMNNILQGTMPQPQIEFLKEQGANSLITELTRIIKDFPQLKFQILNWEMTKVEGKKFVVRIADPNENIIAEIHFLETFKYAEDPAPNGFGGIRPKGPNDFDPSAKIYSRTLGIVCKFRNGEVKAVNNISIERVMFAPEPPGKILKEAIETRKWQTERTKSAAQERAAVLDIAASFGGLFGQRLEGVLSDAAPAKVTTSPTEIFEKEINLAIEQAIGTAEPRIKENEDGSGWQVKFTFTDPSLQKKAELIVEAKFGMNIQMELEKLDLEAALKRGRSLKEAIGSGGEHEFVTGISFQKPYSLSLKVDGREFKLSESNKIKYLRAALTTIYSDTSPDVLETEHSMSKYILNKQNEAFGAMCKFKRREIIADEKKAVNGAYEQNMPEEAASNLSLIPAELSLIEQSKMELIYLPECDLLKLNLRNLASFRTDILKYYPFLSNWPVVIEGIFNGLKKNEGTLQIFIDGNTDSCSKTCKVGGWMAVEVDLDKLDEKGLSGIAPIKREHSPVKLLQARAECVRQSIRLEEYKRSGQMPAELGTFGFRNIIETLYAWDCFNDHPHQYEILQSQAQWPIGDDLNSGPIILVPPEKHEQHLRDHNNRQKDLTKGTMLFSDRLVGLDENYTCPSTTPTNLFGVLHQLKYGLTYRPLDKSHKDFQQGRR